MENQIQSETETVQEEVKIDDPKAVLEALDRAKNDAKRFREEKEKLENDLNTRDQLVSEYSNKLLKEKVKSEFEKQGIKDSERFFRFLDLNQIKLDDQYNLLGFDDQFNTIKKDFPEIFDPKLRVGGQADGAASTSVSTKISATELQARQILGRL